MHTNTRQFTTAFDNGVDDHFVLDSDAHVELGVRAEDGIIVVFEGPLGWQKATPLAVGANMELSL